jgi:hypothetical protein
MRRSIHSRPCYFIAAALKSEFRLKNKTPTVTVFERQRSIDFSNAPVLACSA